MAIDSPSSIRLQENEFFNFRDSNYQKLVPSLNEGSFTLGLERHYIIL
jgi:hypothetical protein